MTYFLIAMKILFQFSFLFLAVNCFSQPDPSQFYPERIIELTEQLKTDSLNAELLWERVQMQIALERRRCLPIKYHKIEAYYVPKKNEAILHDLTYLIDSNCLVREYPFYGDSKIDVLFARGCYYAMIESQAEAVSDLLEVLEIDKEKRFQIVAMNRISEVYLVAGEYDSAMVYCEKMMVYERMDAKYNSRPRAHQFDSYDLKALILKSSGKSHLLMCYYIRGMIGSFFRLDFERANELWWMGSEYRKELRKERRYHRSMRKHGVELYSK